MSIVIDAETAEVADEEIENLLIVTYVHEASRVPRLRAAFKTDAVRAHGQLLVTQTADRKTSRMESAARAAQIRTHMVRASDDRDGFQLALCSPCGRTRGAALSALR